jgi:hypothetical protein
VKVGDKVRFPFAKKELEGTVQRVFDKTVYLRADMPHQKGKLIKRKAKDIKS